MGRPHPARASKVSSQRKPKSAARSNQTRVPSCDPIADRTIVAAKFRPPRISNAIPRRHLLLLLSAAANRKLVVVTAPAGSGKTTLLSQWHRQHMSTESIAWLSLDTMDRRPERFAAYCAIAIAESLGRSPDMPVFMPLDTFAVLSPSQYAEWVSKSFRQSQGRCTVIVDDCHLLAGSSSMAILACLIRSSPPCVRWMLAGEGADDIGCAEFKLQDELTVIDFEALQFDAETILQLSRKLGMPAAASPVDLEALRRRTEGWAAGVKFALLAASNELRDPDRRLIAGASADIAHFFTYSVLNKLSDDARQFLLATSIVQRLNDQLCNALLGRRDGQFMLQKLHAAQVFIRPLDGDRVWYQYHPLFREYLSHELVRLQPDLLGPLNVAASRWYAERDLFHDALTHAFDGHDRGWCLDLVADAARHWLQSGEIDKILHWTKQLSREELMQRQGIATAYIACLIFCRRFAAAAAALREADRALTLHTMQCVDDQARSRLQTLRLMLDVLADADDNVDGDLPEPSVCDNYLSGTLLALQAYWLVRRGRFESGRLRALRAREILERRRSTHGVGYADVVICIADRALGDLDAVVTRCERMFATVKRDRHGPAWVNAATALAYLRYEQNRLAEAETLYQEILPRLSSVSTMENLANVYLTLARLIAIRQQPGEALRLLDQVQAILEDARQPRLLAAVCYEKIRICLAIGNEQRANAVAADFGLGNAADSDAWDARRANRRPWDTGWERRGLSHVALLLQARRFDACRNMLEVLISASQDICNVYRTMVLEAVRASCEWQAGDSIAAFAALNRSWGLVSRFGLTRTAFDESPALPMVVVTAIRERQLQFPLPAKYLEKFHNALPGPPRPTAGPAMRHAAPYEPLTDREVEVLRLLACGFSNQEIGERSHIALSTAKWHLKNLFAKLDVTSRTGAIARARELQLLE